MAEPNAEPQTTPAGDAEPGTSDGTPQGDEVSQATVADLQAQLAARDGKIGELTESNRAWQSALTWQNQAGGKEFIESLRGQFSDPAALKAAVEQAQSLNEWQGIIDSAKGIGKEDALEWLRLYSAPTDKPTPAPQPQPQPNQPPDPAAKPVTQADVESLLETRDRAQALSEQKSVIAEAVATDLRPGSEEADPKLTEIAGGRLDEAIKNITGGQRDPTTEEIAVAGRKVKEWMEPLFGKAAGDTPTPPTPDNPTPPELDQSRPGAGPPAKRPEEMTAEELTAAVAARDAEIAGAAGLPATDASASDPGPGAEWR